jgi:hypothetical protein
MLTHISAMMVNRAENWMNGIENDADVLGDSVTSALESAKKALYDLDNPLEPVSKRSLAVQQEIMKEREFYQAFISKLETLQDDKNGTDNVNTVNSGDGSQEAVGQGIT